MGNYFKLTINQAYTFNGTRTQLEERIAGMQNLYLSQWNNTYRLTPDVPFSLQRSGRIKMTRTYIDIDILKGDNDMVQRVKLTTPIRSEYFFIIIIAAVIGFSMPNKNDAVFIIPMPFILIFIFHLIFRTEENWVVSIIKTQLDLVEA